MADRLINDLYPTMPWDEIDAVVFDIGNVLVAKDENKVLEAMFPGDPVLQHRVHMRTTYTPYWNMMDEGMPVDESIVAMAGNEPELLEPIRRFVTGWPDYRHVVEEGRQAVYTCKAHGKKLYVLSNYTSENYVRNEREYDFFSLFDGAVVSAREHMMKPYRCIYDLLIERYQLTPSRTLFIDDSPANIAGAFAAGWHGFCMNEPGKLSTFLGK